MLVLTRRKGQSFQIGDGIEITVTQISGSHVSIGITAPKDLKVLRSELKVKLNKEVKSNDRRIRH